MSITLDLGPEIEAALRADAEAEGRDVAAVAADRLAAWYRARQHTKRPGKPLSRFITEQREKHGLPEDWPRASRFLMSEEDWTVVETEDETTEGTR